MTSALFAAWGPDSRLTYASNSSVTSPNNDRCVAAGSSGDVHAVWYDNRSGTYGIYYKRSTDKGVTWSYDVPLTSDSISYYPSVAVSGSFVHVVWQEARKGRWEIHYKRSTDLGVNWGSDSCLVSDTGLIQISSRQPAVAASDSAVHVVWQDNRIIWSDRIWYKRSLDNGVTWSSEVSLSTPLAGGTNYPSVSAKGTYVHVVWRDNSLGNYELFHKRSQNSGSSWSDSTRLTNSNGNNWVQYPNIFSSSSYVHVVWTDVEWGNNGEICYVQSTNNGATWISKTRLTDNSGVSENPSICAVADTVHLVWNDNGYGGPGTEIYYKKSTDNGSNWTSPSQFSFSWPAHSATQPFVSASGSNVHLVWVDGRDGNNEIYYKSSSGSGCFPGFQTEPSQGRHYVREPGNPDLHLFMRSEDSLVYYTKTTDYGSSWSQPFKMDTVRGCYPTTGLIQLPLGMPINVYDVCLAYKPSYHSNQLRYKFYNWLTGQWSTLSTLNTTVDPGPPSLITDGWTNVYLAYQGSDGRIYCRWFPYSSPASCSVEVIDGNTNCSQPCLGVDGNGAIYATWVRGEQIRYARRNGGAWNDTSRVDQNTRASKQPFIECYGDSVFVSWADSMSSPNYSFDVWRARKGLTDTTWQDRYNVSNSSNLASESPTQAWREFTTWSEATNGAQPDVWYYSPNSNWGKGDVCANTATWSYWPHSQMYYWNDASGTHADLWSAWTERQTASSALYTTLTKSLTFSPPPPGGDDDGVGSYYGVLAGQDEPSPYCCRRDGVLKFKDKAVDYARDSLVYELPYLSPMYDYYARVVSYREAGNDWACALSLNGQAPRTVKFAPKVADTAWVKIPWGLYKDTRKVVFTAKNVRGDYVTLLRMTLYQVDRGSKGGGPQSRELVGSPVREIFAVYPNPMNSQAVIDYSLKVPGKVNLAVYDVMGRLVRRVVDEIRPAGVYRVAWDGKTQDSVLAPSGVYFVRLSAPERVKTKRLVIVR